MSEELPLVPPKRTIECPHLISATLGNVAFCTMCGVKWRARDTCDHGVSLRDRCYECAPRQMAWWQRFLARLSNSK